MPQSINQNSRLEVLPNFRSLGVMLRIVLLVNCMAVMVAMTQATSWFNCWQRMLNISTLMQPALLMTLLLLFSLNPFLRRLSYWYGNLVITLTGVLSTLFVLYLEAPISYSEIRSIDFLVIRNGLLAATASEILLLYLRIRTMALSPAIHEARLQALQARIRPHFLFNTINAVLGIVRSDPKQAERALEDMSDLFRMAMAQNRELVQVKHEISLARQYLALEQLRLSDRLNVIWNTEHLPDDALMPPLILQPLLENAVYHGIEPAIEGGNIKVTLAIRNNQLHLEMINPVQKKEKPTPGNKIALANIRERLALQFDIEAQYTVNVTKDAYQVNIVMPYLQESSLRGESR